MTRVASGGARRVKMSPAIRAMDTLSEPDYAAGWESPVHNGDTRSAEQWVRATFEGAPRELRAFIVAGWVAVLGVRLAPRSSPDQVLGWTMATNRPDLVILEAPFRFGTAHNLLSLEGSKVLFATFVRYEKRGGRIVWLSAAPLHQRIIPYLLGRAAMARES